MSRVRRPLGELATAGERQDRSGTTTPTNAAGTTAAQAGLRRIRDAQFFVTQCKRAMILLIAFTGLIGAACVNGIPSITCYALADAYTISLANLGALFLIEFFVIVIVVGVEKQLKDANVYTIKNFRFRLGMAVAFVLVVVLFFAIMQTTIHGVKNIQAASTHCLLEDTHNRNDRIPLLRGLSSENAT